MGRARARDAENPRARLEHGGIAEVAASEFTTGFELVVDGTPQSHVDLDDPTHLHFEYIVRMGAVIDQVGEPGRPLTAVHLGAGALTIPRYVEATRPGSRQQVIELEAPLVQLVREYLPLPAARRFASGSATRAPGSASSRRHCRGSATSSSPTSSPARRPPLT